MPRELVWFRDKWPSCHKQKLPRKSSPRRRNLTPVMMGAYSHEDLPKGMRKRIPLVALAIIDPDRQSASRLKQSLHILAKSGADLKFLMTSLKKAESSDLIRVCRDNSITLLDWNDIQVCVQNQDLDQGPADDSEVGGLAFCVGDRHVQRIMDKNIKFSYVLLNGVGRSLQERLSNAEGSEEKPVAFAFFAKKNEGSFSIWGYAVIRSVDFMQLSEIENLSGPLFYSDLLWSEQERIYFMNSFSVNTNEHQDATILGLENSVFLKTELLINNDALVGDEASFINEQLEIAGGWGGVYLTTAMVDTLLKQLSDKDLTIPSGGMTMTGGIISKTDQKPVAKPYPPTLFQFDVREGVIKILKTLHSTKIFLARDNDLNSLLDRVIGESGEFTSLARMLKEQNYEVLLDHLENNIIDPKVQSTDESTFVSSLRQLDESISATLQHFTHLKKAEAIQGIGAESSRVVVAMNLTSEHLMKYIENAFIALSAVRAEGSDARPKE